MNAGYVRLSRDDDRRNYVSIENQKLIIQQFASGQNQVIDCWYEDDGVSGYHFDRPGFNQLIKDLDQKIDRVFVKDFSRLGRHNAKVLLLLDEFRERNKQLIVIDDAYDSLRAEDDIIGIKTWYNERYVKEASKKIRSALQARQIDGSLITQLPFGYRRNENDKRTIEIIDSHAECVRLVYKLYLNGLGYRRIANRLTQEGVPTPSMILGEREIRDGKVSKRRIAFTWSEAMVKDMLGNDFYTGVLRLHKRHRKTIHGKDKRVPKEEQYTFENHHPAIIGKTDFERVQEMKAERMGRREYSGTPVSSFFGGCIFCRDCGSRLTPIRRKTGGGEYRYYICSRYNTKGKQGCSRSHLIKEKDILEDIMAYLSSCMNFLREEMAEWSREEFVSRYREEDRRRQESERRIRKQKKQLQLLLEQRLRSVSNMGESILEETYNTLEAKILLEIQKEEEKLRQPRGINQQPESLFFSPLQVLERVMERGTVDHRDIALLVEKILVDEEGFPEFNLKHSFSQTMRICIEEGMNRKKKPEFSRKVT